MHHKLTSPPLQSYTDFYFRNVFLKFFSVIDIFYAPYIPFNGKMTIKSVYEKYLLPKNNTNLVVIPQVMTYNANEFIFAANFVQSLGWIKKLSTGFWI